MQLRDFRGKGTDFWEIVVRKLEIRGLVKVLAGMEGMGRDEGRGEGEIFTGRYGLFFFGLIP